jgi:hypothetical protein
MPAKNKTPNAIRGSCFDAVRMRDLRPALSRGAMKKHEIAMLWRVSELTAQHVLGRLRQSGEICKLWTNERVVLWMLPADLPAAKAMVEAIKREAFKAKRQRSNARHYLKRNGIDPGALESDDTDELPVKRTICPAGAPLPFEVTAARSAFEWRPA